MQAELDKLREKMRAEIEALAQKQKRFLGSVVVDELKPSGDNAVDISEEIVLKPSKLMLAISILMVPPEMIFFLWVMYYIAKDSSLLMIVCFIALFAFIFFKTIRQTLFILKEVIVINNRGITIGKQIYQWDNILDCYFVTYGFGKSVSNSIMIVLMNGEIKEHYMSTISATKVNNAVFHYMQQYRSTTSQPS